MHAKRSLRTPIYRSPSALLAGGLLVLGCASEHVEVARPKKLSAIDAAAPSTTAADSAASGTTAARLPHAPRAASPVRRPELGITTPMKGEPAGAAAAESRLVRSSCEQATADEIEPVLREMRASVDRSFKDWHDGQPGCWEQMREEYRFQKAMELYSGGALGLSGYGTGGGGRGEGIGLGSIGTIGHGAAAMPARVTNAPKSATRVSGTNNQVAGVEEADLVKTDGRYVYFASGGALRIVEALDPKVVSVTGLEGTARELFVEGDRAVVYTSIGNVGRVCTYGYDCSFSGDGTRTSVYVLDISDRAAPRITRSFGLSGSLMAARRIGHAVHTVVADGDAPDAPPYESWPAPLEMCGTPEAVVRAKFAKLKTDNEAFLRASALSTKSGFPTLTEKGGSRVLCNNLLRTALRDGKAFTTVVSFDLTDDKTAPSTATLQSRPGAVFASETGLYISVVHRKGASTSRWYSSYAAADEVSEIHKFQIGDKPKDTRYVGSGTVPGHVLNQFSMDEWYGYLRVATTKGKVPDPKVESVISILAEQPGGRLARVGAIDKIAPGEDIRAVRFDDDRGYVVTFKKTDPLFVVDLFEPRKPAILGELKIPGFSTYIHRVDPEHLLSIGFDADDHGGFAYFNGVILQLFDVKNPTDPRLLHKEKIGTRGSSSEAATDHLAFNYLAQDGLLAVPMTICDGGGDGKAGSLSFSGLLVYDVDLDRGFTRLGGVDHGTHGVSCDTWWSNANSAVKRSVFLDDLVYSITGERVKVQRMTHFGTDVASLSLVNGAAAN